MFMNTDLEEFNGIESTTPFPYRQFYFIFKLTF